VILLPRSLMSFFFSVSSDDFVYSDAPVHSDAPISIIFTLLTGVSSRCSFSSYFFFTLYSSSMRCDRVIWCTLYFWCTVLAYLLCSYLALSFP
jgi:hypothetical protein